MVAPFIDLRDGDAENFIYLVLSGLTTRPTLPASLLNSIHSTIKSVQLIPLLHFHNNKFLYCVGLLVPCQTPNLEDQGIPFCLGHHLDLSGMRGPTSSICYRQHSSQEHVTTQAPPLHQQCSQTQSKVYLQYHRPSVTPTSIKILHKHTHIYISTNMLSENRKESKTF